MVRFGVPGQNINTLSYADIRLPTVPAVEAPRRPTVTDKRYPLWCEWRVTKEAIAPALEGEFWKLVRFESNGDATWVMYSSGGGGPAISFETDDGAPNVLPDGFGEVQIFGGAGINVTGQGPGNTITVSLAGGGVAVDQINVDFNTAPGTDPVTPDANGEISIFGNAVTNGTNANAPVATHSRALNTFQIDVQLATALAPTPADPFDVGLASFNNTQFTVDGNGFVSLVGSNNPVLQTLTGDDAVAVGPDANGNIDINGTAVNNATNAKPLYFYGDAGSNLMEAEIQVSVAIPSAPGDKNDAGICSFDSASFNVDIDGFVQLIGGNPINPLSNPLEWDDFLSGVTPVSSSGGKLWWIITGGVVVNDSNDRDSDHPGIWSLRSTGITDNGIQLMTLGVTRGSVVLGGGEITWTWVARIDALSDGTDTFIIYLGAFDEIASLTDGLYFTYTHSVNSGNWVINSTASSTTTSTNTSTAADTDWHRFDITINAAGTSVDFFIDGVQVGSAITTNIPTVGLPAAAWQDRNAGTADRRLNLDYFQFSQTLTNSR